MKIALLLPNQPTIVQRALARHAGPTRQLFCVLTLSACLGAQAQTPTPSATPAASAVPTSVERDTVGDAPDDPGPLATDLSPAINHAAVARAAEKVATWQLARSEETFNRQWTYAALYDGMLAASKTTGDPRFHDAMVKMGRGFDWKLVNDRFPNADDMALGQSFMDLYLESRDPARDADTKAVLDQLVVRQDDPSKLLWWWCDALFMAPPVLARMSVATGDRRYLDYMDKEWWETSRQPFRPSGISLFPRQSLLHSKAEQRAENFLVTRQRLGDGCSRQSS